jgi:hypothetical protein
MSATCVGRVYQQTSPSSLVPRCTIAQHAITAVDLLNDRVLPLFEEHDV